MSILKISYKSFIIIPLTCVLISVFVLSNNKKSKLSESDVTVKLGAYYFDGWTGIYPYHITPALKKSFPEREPKWGWITSSQVIMNEQINLAANSGLSFFSFCWYYTGEKNYKKEPLNRSLGFYLNSPNIKKLQYNLLVANHSGFEIGPDDWATVTYEWISQFKSNSYLMVNGKPVITFFSLSSLVNKFKTVDKIREALINLRQQAIKSGLKGVSIAIVLNPREKDIKLAEDCGFDVITGYNYHDAGLKSDKRVIPIDEMRKAEVAIWNQFSQLTRLPYMPVTTLNWDPRPWANSKNNYSTASYFKGFSGLSAYNSVLSCKNWIKRNSKNTVKEKIGIIYAWNEYGEGAYLTPTKKGMNPLKSIKKALKN
ncbi:glycoside hydrolase family 99-like domain-containing protein [Flavobacterium sp. XS2P12]|uniref:glycoside hydrolase family 99-like domain-containing protein n=1 Tax=Flavobacterium melibiosi TaxID=3398734 RepID=UPI003A88D984